MLNALESEAGATAQDREAEERESEARRRVDSPLREISDSQLPVKGELNAADNRRTDHEREARGSSGIGDDRDGLRASSSSRAPIETQGAGGEKHLPCAPEPQGIGIGADAGAGEAGASISPARPRKSSTLSLLTAGVSTESDAGGNGERSPRGSGGSGAGYVRACVLDFGSLCVSALNS